MICIVVANQDKWTSVLEGKAIGTSKHVDYSTHHFRARDVAALKKPITMFIWVGNDDKVIEVIFTDQLKERNVSYKSAKRDSTELNPAELTLVAEAIKLARAAPQPKATEPAKAPAAAKPVLDFNPGDPDTEEQKAAEQPPATNAPEAAATAVDNAQAQAPDELKGEQPEGAADGEAPADEPAEDAWDQQIAADLAAGNLDPLIEAAKREVLSDAEDPLSTVKPSRTHNKKKRRA